MKKLAGIFSLLMLLAAQVAAWEISHPVYLADTNIDESVVADYMSMSEAELCALITEEGGRGTNLTMKQVAYDMARLYVKTGSDAYADNAVILLERFAEVVPNWPLLERDGVTQVPLDEVNWGAWDNGGLWGIWFHQDLETCVEIPLAYDFIAGSGAIERRSTATGRDVKLLIEDDLLRYMVDLNLRHQNGVYAYGNMGGNRINGIIPFGRICEPDYIHLVVGWLRNFPTTVYFRDGVWSETSPAYHEQITGRVIRTLPEDLAGYSDPPGYSHPDDGSRFDDLVVLQGIEPTCDRIRTAMDHLTLPNDYLLALHDSHADKRSWYSANDTSEPYCYFGMRHAVLGRFSDSEQVQAHLHFGGTDGHEHADCLNIVLWALGAELISEGDYKNFGNRPWNASTAGHNTVVVDETNQRNRFDGQFELSQDDAVDNVGFFTYQDMGHGNTKNFGDLRLWDTTHPNLQVVEADGENSYADIGLALYRRTLVLVEIEATDLYLIDVFRVKGGQTHDWMLHGNLGEDYGFWTDLSLNPISGQRYDYLDLQQTVTSAANWTSEFSLANGTKVRTTMLGQAATEISTGRAPAMRRDGQATFLDVRRGGGDNLFVAVHEPYTQNPKVQNVTALQYDGRAESAVIIKIELAGGRVDYFAATLDQPPYPEHSIAPEGLAFRGRLAHIAKSGADLMWVFLAEGSSISIAEVDIAATSGDFSWRGQIDDIMRVKKGNPFNGFLTASSLPTDGRLAGKTILLTLPDGRTEGYTIASVSQQAGSYQIITNEEPGIELRDGGNLVKLVYFPWHGLRGEIDFFIPGSLYRNAQGVIESTAIYTSPDQIEPAAPTGLQLSLK
ncbi:MAG: heparinase II/III family protein [Deltaproteobacteria bacterium]|nr:heparinase II/III family protein [Deltaproteobacteria bacterium]